MKTIEEAPRGKKRKGRPILTTDDSKSYIANSDRSGEEERKYFE